MILAAAPFTVVDASGPPFEFGRAIGMAVGASVKAAVFDHAEFAENRRQWAASTYLSKLEAAARDVYPWVVEEMEGMAAGIGVDFEDILLWNCRGDLRLADTDQARLRKTAVEGCTTIMAPATPNRAAIIAHNEDGAAAFSQHRYWLRARPELGPSFESYLYPGMLPGHSFAVTGAGLVQTINNIRPDDLRPGVPRHVICRAVLGSETLDDALGHLKRTDRASGFHHALARAGENRVLSVEAPASTCIVRELNTPQAHANHLIDPETQTIGQTVTGSSDYRQQAAENYLSGGGDPDQPERILFHRGQGNECVLRRPGDGGDDYGCTLATGVFRIDAGGINWTVHAGPDARDALGGRIAAGRPG